jgi:hypothetical protein
MRVQSEVQENVAPAGTPAFPMQNKMRLDDERPCAGRSANL